MLSMVWEKLEGNGTAPSAVFTKYILHVSSAFSGNNPKDKNWGDDGRALKNSIEF